MAHPGIIPIAICGMGMRLPGGVEDAESFWQLLMDKREARTRIPFDRFNVNAFYHPGRGDQGRSSGKPGSIVMQHGYFLESTEACPDPIRTFDGSAFNMSRREIERLDPQQRLMLQVVRECFESAGVTGWRGSRIGCFTGTFGSDWGDLQGCDKQRAGGLYNVTGNGDFLLSNRISYEYDLKGPSFTVKTACSSSMLALHLACNALKNHECDGAIVGGANLIMAPLLSIAMTDQGILSPEGRCKTFDASANGYGRGEAVNAVFLKRLDEAERDGNPVRAVIRATGTNCDGKSQSLAAPSLAAHEMLMKDTLTAGGIDLEANALAGPAFVECHGTGTAIGDPLEASAVASVLSGVHTFIGSVKPNVGHSEGASGITSVIKSVLALEKQTIPPNINFLKANPKIPLAQGSLTVPVEALPWPHGRPERIGINSYGMGGANVHVLLDSAASWGVDGHGTQRLQNGTEGVHHRRDGIMCDDDTADTQLPHLLVLSANTPESLRGIIHKTQKYIQARGELSSCLRHDIAYTLSQRREHLRCRAYTVVEKFNEINFFSRPCSPVRSVTAKVTFVFTGQGAQWRGMGRELLQACPSFAADIAQMDQILDEVSSPASPRTWTIESQLHATTPSAPAVQSSRLRGQRLDEAEVAQPVCTALQVALVNLWRKTGIEPDSVIGHSSGEIAAAYAYGELSMREAILVAYFRGRAIVTTGSQRGIQHSGAMAAIGIGISDLSDIMSKCPGAVVACENSASSVTVSGAREAVEGVVDLVKRRWPTTLARLLRVDQAYHSHYMEDVGTEYLDLLTTFLPAKGSFTTLKSHQVGQNDNKVTMISTVTGRQVATDDKLSSASYWRRNLESQVRFYQGMKELIASMGSAEGRVFLEIGPHGALAGPVRQILHEEAVSVDQEDPSLILTTLTRGRNSASSFLTAVGELFTRTTISLDLAVLCGDSNGNGNSNSNNINSNGNQNINNSFGDNMLIRSGISNNGSSSSCCCHLPGRVVVDLPLYSWDLTERYWEESRVAQNWRMRHLLPHELLGAPVLEWNARQPTWRNILRLEDVSWIRGHRVQGQVVFPATAYFAMAGESVRELDIMLSDRKKKQQHMGSSYRLRDVAIKNALVLSDGVEVELMTTLSKHRLTDSLESEYYEFSIASCSADGARWTEHCFGQVNLEESSVEHISIEQIQVQDQQQFARQVSEDRWYDTLSRVGLEYTGSFRRLRSITADPISFRARASVPMLHHGLSSSQSDNFYALHPSTMDTFLQLLTVSAVRGEARLLTTLSLPIFVDELRVIDNQLEPNNANGDGGYFRGSLLHILARADPSRDGSFVGSAMALPLSLENGGAQREWTFHMSGLTTRHIDATSKEASASVSALSALEDAHGAVQLHWKPHLEFSDPHTLMRSQVTMDKAAVCLEELTILSALDIEEESSSSCVDTCVHHAGTPAHLAKYHDWLVTSFLSSVKSDDNALIPNASKLICLPRIARRRRRETLLSELLASPLAPCAASIDAIRAHWRGLLAGTVDPLALLMQDATLHKVYDLLSSWDYEPLLDLLGHMNPTLRVLEIGAGTGGMTANIVPVLFGREGSSPRSERQCSTYTYTDISAGFFTEARARFAAYEGCVEYAVLDITKDPVPQIIAPRGGGTGEDFHYDLIIAANVLHATPSLQDTLANVRKLLRPVEGRLLLQELSPTSRFANFIWGILPGWWLGQDDGRPREPYVSRERWQAELEAAGFQVDACVLDGPVPFQVNASILASTAAPRRAIFNCHGATSLHKRGISHLEDTGVVTLLYGGGEPSKKAKVLVTALQEAGLRLRWHNLLSSQNDDDDDDQIDNASKNIISLLDMQDRPFISELNKTEFDQLMALLCRLQNSGQGLFWITHPAQMDCEDPRYAQVLGLARNVRSELAVDFCTVEVASLGASTPDDGGENSNSSVSVELQQDISAVVELYRRKFHQTTRLRHSKDDNGRSISPQDNDMEFAVRGGVLYIPRFHWLSLKDEITQTSQRIESIAPESVADDEHATTCASVLRIRQRGILGTLQWAPLAIPATPGPDEIIIRVGACGLNFKDVLVAMGIVDGSTLGYEAAGEIEQVGSSVSHFQVGDRAMVFASDCLATHIVSKESMAARIPDRLSTVEAATMPVVYTTVIRSLVDLARLSRGQSVLIHCASGGVGIAAIRISQMVGAEIFATAGNVSKRAWLSSTFAIPPDHIFNSRTPAFRQGIMHATDGRGVDLVLNSLSGELLHESWACVAPFGTMVEIGKRDLLGRGKLSMHPFLENRSYQCIDMHQISLQRQDIAKHTLELMLQYYNDGYIHPIAPVKVVPAGDIESAFRYLQKGVHIGKVVVEMPDIIKERSSSAAVVLDNTVKSVVVPKEEALDDSLSRLGGFNGVRFRPDRTYLLAGGFGGLGTATARWMVMRGARHLAFLSRRGRDSSNEGFLAEMQVMGCSIVVVAGDVQNEKAIEKLLQLLTMPLAGVFHLAMTLRDKRLQDMTYDDWCALTRGPRVQGAWNLHNKLAFESVKLDFFLIYGSFSGLVGFWGQANYSATNTFLDAFAQYRQQRLSLPTATLDIGVVGDAGYVSQNRQILEYFKSVDTLILTEQAFLDGVELAILRCLSSGAEKQQQQQQHKPGSCHNFTAPTNFGIGLGTKKPLDDPTNRLVWKNDSRFSMARNFKHQTNQVMAQQPNNASTESTVLRRRARSEPPLLDQPSFVESVAKCIGRAVLGFILRGEDELQLNKSMAEMGVDSLVAIEIRNWCRQQLGVEMSSLKIMNSTFLDLASSTAASWKRELSTDQAGDSENHVEGRIPAEERQKWEEILQVKAP